MKKIYRYYKDRLIEISGRNRSLYSKKVSVTNCYDIGRIVQGDADAISGLIDFLWTGKKESIEVISKKDKQRLIQNIQIATGKTVDEKTIVEREVKKFRSLKRLIDDQEKETGRYELFVGYPFVKGYIDKDTPIKGPLLLFPVVITVDGQDQSASLELKQGDSVLLNKVLLGAYARWAKLSLENIELELSSPKSAGFKNVLDVLKYLEKHDIKISSKDGPIVPFDTIPEPKLGDALEVVNSIVVGRFPLANSIYNDYRILEQQNLTTDAIRKLVENKGVKKKKKSKKEERQKDNNTYTISPLDFAQEEAIRKLDASGNLVIYGPPGTGKSQTIVNIITDALIKNKRILVVSQKKAALDVVFNRLGVLNQKAMYVVDPEKSKAAFFEQVKTSHNYTISKPSTPLDRHIKRYQEVSHMLNKEIASLDEINTVLNRQTNFGISLSEGYQNSHMIVKTDGEYAIYEKLKNDRALLLLSYPQLKETIRAIQEKKRGDIFYTRLEMQKANPFTLHLSKGLDIHSLNSARQYFSALLSKRYAPFDLTGYKNMRQLLGFYLENSLEKKKDLMPLVKIVAKMQKPKPDPQEVYSTFSSMLSSVKAFVKEYHMLERIFDTSGFALAVDSILNSNATMIKHMVSAIEDYTKITDLNTNLGNLSKSETMVLNFAYENSANQQEFNKVLSGLLSIRTYHFIVCAEEEYKQELSKIMDFENIVTRIASLKKEQQKVTELYCADTFVDKYKELYNQNPENNNFFHQVSKTQNLWPIRKLVDVFAPLLFTLYPCWLLSPDSISQILPLTPGLFDLVLFDEASQVFIENTLPTIFRGKHIAVAGDNKQLRPTHNFIRRYMGADEEDENLNTQAALEVESLLDLATSRFESARLNYHYRSKFEELIAFSNHAFYDSRLEVVPNTRKSLKLRPISRVKVDGRWIDRKNIVEADATVEVLKKIFKTRKENETIGIISFNAEQGSYIQDKIDAACVTDPEFRKELEKERIRKENGEDVSLFIKNLENVQGDERDIIIFSIGYAKNEQGKVVAQFGPLNLEGGENRLNVAITRAKKRIFVVTSIEPEELSVDQTKHQGPKLFKKYLQFVRAVDSANQAEVTALLQGLKNPSLAGVHQIESGKMALELKTLLEKAGLRVEENVGQSGARLPLAVYDKDKENYILGIEFDFTALQSSPSTIERDVLRPKFLQDRGWKIFRLFSRDFWLSKQKVVAEIVALCKANKKALKG